MTNTEDMDIIIKISESIEDPDRLEKVIIEAIMDELGKDGGAPPVSIKILKE